MTSERLKSKVLMATIVSAIFGLGIIVYIGFVAFGASGDAFSLAFHPFVGFYGGYLIYMAFALRRSFLPRRIHQYLSAVFIPIALVPMVAILGESKETTWLKALSAIAVFLLVGIIYKVTLAYVGRKLFGNQIIE